MEARVGIYTRISADRNGDALGVARQEADARKLCEARGWRVVEVFCDNDRSAYDPRKTRPAYAAMLQAIREGRINTVVAWHPDRLHRQTRELVGFIDLINAHGVRVETVTAGIYDLSTPSGRLNARMLGDVAEYESEHKSERIRRKLEANAAAGKNHGGSRPFGWSDDRVTLVEEEAAIVREATERVINGESVRSITKALNEAGRTTSTGMTWSQVLVRKMIMRPRNAGLRQHHGEVVGDGKWQPIVSPQDYYQAVAVLTNPSRRTHPGRGGRVHMLSMIARCGVCARGLTVGKTSAQKGEPRSRYRCPEGHIARDQEMVDDYVTRVILARLALPDARKLLVEPERADEAEAAAWRAQELQTRLHDAAEAYAAGAITLAQLTTINNSILPKLEEAQTRAASPSRSRLLGDLVFLDPAEVWQRLAREQRRAVIDLLIEVRIMPTGKGAKFDPESVEITWKS